MKKIVLVTAALIAGVGLSVTLAQSRSDRWWWDNLSGPDSSNFMNLDQITRANVSQLEIAWYYPHAGTLFNPVVVEDVMYVSGRNNALIALDATTGKEIWIHDGMAGMTSRGINYWQSADGKDKRLITAIDGFLQELDATTGKTIRTFGTEGAVDLRAGVPRVEGTAARLQSNSPGKVWQNEIILGSATGEAYVGPPGDIRAYDVITGRKLWQFHTVPLPGEYGYDTWPKDAYKYSGGADNWGSMSVDDARGIVYIPIESAHYEYYGADRLGQNLFANCLVALDARTGRRLWHYQTVHHDIWDYTPTSAPQLVTVTHDGKKVDAVAVASKDGFLYAFNRVTGEPLWPIEERPVPKSDAPGEQAWPTQPFPTKPPAFAMQSFTADDVSPWLASSPEEYQQMKARVANARNGTGPHGGMFIPLSLDADVMNMPGNEGGSNWGTTSAAPAKGLVFVLGINQFGLERLTDPAASRGAGAGAGGAAPNVGGTPPLSPVAREGMLAFQKSCQVCHGANVQGAQAGAPLLAGVTGRMTPEEINAIVTGGRNQMPPVNLSAQELTAVIAYLATLNVPARGSGAGGGPAIIYPPGPVVETGPAPHEPMPASGRAAGVGGTPYPPDAPDVPPVRYTGNYGSNQAWGWNKPPYSTLTAYDLNTGEIKWQVPTGDDPKTVAAGGPHNTGGIAARQGMVVTRSGLVFQVGIGSIVRAYDEDTGKVLWASSFQGYPAAGVPAMYQSKGRQYLIINTGPTPTTRGGFGVISGRPIDQSKPIGTIAYALPVKVP